MTQTVTGLFDNYSEARTAVSALESQGIDDVSLVAHESVGVDENEVAKDAGTGAGIGAVVGGGAGLLAGLGLLAIPGVGPVVAAGWLAATAAGAVAGTVAGAATGGIVGALTESGVPDEDAHVYAEGVRRGGTLVTARVREDQVAIANTILKDHAAVDLNARRNAYREGGWSSFDEKAPPFGPGEIEADRARYHRGAAL